MGVRNKGKWKNNASIRPKTGWEKGERYGDGHHHVIAHFSCVGGHGQRAVADHGPRDHWASQLRSGTLLEWRIRRIPCLENTSYSLHQIKGQLPRERLVSRSTKMRNWLTWPQPENRSLSSCSVAAHGMLPTKTDGPRAPPPPPPPPP